MRAKHPSIRKKNQEDNVSEKEPINESITIVNMEAASKDVFWFENEEDDIHPRSISPPSFLPPSTVSTQELDKLLPRPESRDSILSQIYQAERQMEERDLEPNWFNQSFGSVYAENLRLESSSSKCGDCEKTTSEMNKLRKHLDNITVKTNIFFKKTEAQKTLLRKQIKKSEATECEECPLRASVEEDQAKAIKTKETELEEIKKQLKLVKERNIVILVEQKKMKREKKDMEKNKKEHEGNLKELQNTNSELEKNNATLKIELKSKDNIIEGLKELIGIDEYNDEEKEEETVSFEKEISGPVCLTCNKKFPEKSALDQHMHAKHNKGECPLCDEVFPLGAALEKHTDECMESIKDNAHECPDCKNTFMTKKALKTHTAKKKCNHQDNKFICPNCKMIINNENEMKKHKQRCTNEGQLVKERSKLVCKHWRRGNCCQGESCGFSHVGHQNITTHEGGLTKSAGFTSACRHGSSCEWLARGKCSYFHKNVGVQMPFVRRKNNDKDQHQEAPRGITRRRQECRHAANCRNFPNCIYLHSLEDFPDLLTGNQPIKPMRKVNRRQ